VETSAIAPGHITGLFGVYSVPGDYIRTSSTGAGFSLERGMSTRIRVNQATRLRYDVKINGKPTTDFRVSERVIQIFAGYAGPFEVEVYHQSELPIGAGFGTSAAGALSLALALDDALKLNLGDRQAAIVAHMAEVTCRTGLGTVGAIEHGGFEMRLKPGPPGSAQIVRYDRGDYWFVGLCNGPMSTPFMLKRLLFLEDFNNRASKLLSDLSLGFTPDNFMIYSREFTEAAGLCSDWVKRVLDASDSAGMRMSMAMFGETVFTLVDSNAAEDTARLLQFLSKGEGTLIVSPLAECGARIG